MECYKEDVLTQLTTKKSKFRTETSDSQLLPQLSRL